MNLKIEGLGQFLVAVVLTLGIGCKANTNAEGDLVKLRIGYIPVTHCLPLFLAVDQGLFEKEGLGVELVSLAGGAKILEALAAKEVDIGFSNVLSPILGRAQGIPFVMLGGGPVEDTDHRDHAIMVRSDSPLRTLSDLKGKKIGINTRRAIDHLMLLVLLNKQGISESEVELVEVPFPRMLGALSSAAVDAVAIAEPFVTLGLEKGDTRVLSWNYVEARPTTYVSTYVTLDSLASGKSTAMQCFSRAIVAAEQLIRQDPTLARRVLAKYLQIDEGVAAKIGLPRFEDEIDATNLAETIQLALDTGILESPVPVEQLLSGNR